MTSEAAEDPKHWTSEENHNYDPPHIIRYDPTPGGIRNEDGTTTYSLTFPALQVTDLVADKAESAASIAAELNLYPRLKRDNAELRARFDLRTHLARQRQFSEKTFGPGARVKGVVDHIRKELIEIEASPGDLSEWINVVILALDGAWRAGGTPDTIIAALVAEQGKNEARVWPDWRTADPDKAIEHDRSEDGHDR